MATARENNYLRGVLGARLALKDHWAFFFFGMTHKKVNAPFAFAKDAQSPGQLSMSPRELRDPRRKRSVWVSVIMYPKEGTSRGDVALLLRRLGAKGPMDDDLDIFLIISPNDPGWAKDIAERFLGYLFTGEGGQLVWPS